MSRKAAELGDINMQMHVDASPEDVWASLTESIGEWWPADFYAGGEEGARSFTLESWPGGRMFEAWENGGGALWGTVVCVEPNHRLQVHGSLFPNWGGPTEWFGTWELKAEEGGTLLSFNEGSIGRLSDSGAEEKDKGWQFLCRSLKAHAEGAAPPAWED